MYLRSCFEFRFHFKAWGRTKISCFLNAYFDFEEHSHPDAILSIVSLFLHTSTMQISTSLEAPGIKGIRSDPEEIRLWARKKKRFNKIGAMPGTSILIQTDEGA